jgi:hypothetical protein
MFATGDYVVTWDDDDIFLPHFMQQAMDRMNETKLPSFKPAMSFFYSGGNLRLVANTLEASVVASAQKVREYGYLLESLSRSVHDSQPDNFSTFTCHEFLS